MEFPILDEEVIDSIQFYYEVDRLTIAEANYKDWLQSVAKNEQKKIGILTYIFCDDEYLQAINWKYLKHKSLTDIITFQYHDSPIEAEIYISVERVKENAIDLNTPFDNELNRVIVHGLLHCCGFRDKLPEEKHTMRCKEDEALLLLSSN